MTDLADLFDPDLLDKHLHEKNIRMQRHPSLPLSIYNYTERCVYESAWDVATLTCRGLIVGDNQQVKARPFPKFFNHGQPGAPDLDLSAPAVVTDKADGSLGILYPTPDGWAIATRGSFTSEQALHATDVWKERYEGRVLVGGGLTWLFEIVYPDNRIVIDYGPLDDLILLGAIDVRSGRAVDLDTLRDAWPGPAVDTFDYPTVADALAAPPRDNAEGLVVHVVESDTRIKLKQDDYVRLHRIVTGLSARTVWQHLVDGRPLDELIAPLPDEFHPWVREVADELDDQVASRRRAIETYYQALLDDLPDGFTRKEFATEAVKSPERAALFALLDGKDITAALWRDAKPDPFRTPGRTFTEDTA